MDAPRNRIVGAGSFTGTNDLLLVGRRFRLLATIEDRAVVEKILTHLELPVDLPRPSAARTPEWLPGVRAGADHQDDTGGQWAD